MKTEQHIVRIFEKKIELDSLQRTEQGKNNGFANGKMYNIMVVDGSLECLLCSCC